MDHLATTSTLNHTLGIESSNRTLLADFTARGNYAPSTRLVIAS